MCDINRMSGGNVLAQTEYHAQLGFLRKGRTIKGLVVCKTDWDLDPLDLQNCLALDDFQAFVKSLGPDRWWLEYFFVFYQ